MENINLDGEDRSRSDRLEAVWVFRYYPEFCWFCAVEVPDENKPVTQIQELNTLTAFPPLKENFPFVDYLIPLDCYWFDWLQEIKLGGTQRAPNESDVLWHRLMKQRLIEVSNEINKKALEIILQLPPISLNKFLDTHFEWYLFSQSFPKEDTPEYKQRVNDAANNWLLNLRSMIYGAEMEAAQKWHVEQWILRNGGLPFIAVPTPQQEEAQAPNNLHRTPETELFRLRYGDRNASVIRALYDGLSDNLIECRFEQWERLFVDNGLPLQSINWQGREVQLACLFQGLSLDTSRIYRLLATHFKKKDGREFNPKQLPVSYNKAAQQQPIVSDLIKKVNWLVST